MVFKVGDYIVGGYKGNSLGQIIKVSRSNYMVLWNNGNYCKWPKKSIRLLEGDVAWRLAKPVEVTLYWNHPKQGVIVLMKDLKLNS
jgi:hypothetical protein